MLGSRLGDYSKMIVDSGIEWNATAHSLILLQILKFVTQNRIHFTTNCNPQVTVFFNTNYIKLESHLKFDC